jgi:hypothetical protein
MQVKIDIKIANRLFENMAHLFGKESNKSKFVSGGN